MSDYYDQDETVGFDPYDDEAEVQRELAHEAEQERHDRWADETFG
jgi:hypothetical protein